MHVRIDETRRHEASARINRLGAARSRTHFVVRADERDLLALDGERFGPWFPGVSSPNLRVDDRERDRWFSGRFWRRLARAAGRKEKCESERLHEASHCC